MRIQTTAPFDRDFRALPASVKRRVVYPTAADNSDGLKTG
jgi:hypothetical protein